MSSNTYILAYNYGIVKYIKVLKRERLFMYFQRLRDLREDMDMTQKQVSEVLGIQQTVYSRYERGFQNIPIEHLIRLADLYGTSTDYILGRTLVKKPYPKKQR